MVLVNQSGPLHGGQALWQGSGDIRKLVYKQALMSQTKRG